MASSDPADTTLVYQQVQAMQPCELVQQLELENLDVRGNVTQLRARLLCQRLQQVCPAISMVAREISNEEQRLFFMRAIESAMRNAREMGFTMQKDDDGADKNPDDSGQSIDYVAEKNRMDYLSDCMKLLGSWNLRYCGVNDEDAEYFLENLKDFRKFTKIDDRVLLLVLPLVMVGEAKTWYRSCDFTSWIEFEAAFALRPHKMP